MRQQQGGIFDAAATDKVEWRVGSIDEANELLATEHYLGPIAGGRLIHVGVLDGFVVAAQVWRLPTSRRLPSDGSWLELSRWCLTPEAGENAGSRQHSSVLREIKQLGGVRVLVSYSDPSAGHTGSLYRACSWEWAPGWHRLRPPPTGNGQWTSGVTQAVKDRWVFRLRRRDIDSAVLAVNDAGAIRHWLRSGPSEVELRLARRSPAADLAAAAAEYEALVAC